MDLSIFRIDIDGTLNRLDIGVLNREAKIWDDYDISSRKTIVECVNSNPEILMRSPESEYLQPLNDLYEEHGQTMRILTSQRNSWRKYKELWISTHLTCSWNIEYANTIQDKLKYVKPGEYLIDDYPGFEEYHQVWLIDRPYNRQVEVPMRICTPKGLISKMKKFSDY